MKKIVRYRHKVILGIIKPFIKAFTKKVYNYTPIKYKLDKKPYLVLANHCMNLDCFFISQSFNFPIYYVATDNIFRRNLKSKLLKFAVHPVPKIKGDSDVKTIKDLQQIVKDGGSVGLFPEGNQTYTGEGIYMSPAIGKLIKFLKLDVIFYNLEGTYLTLPRWADYRRRGKVVGYIKKLMPYEEYKDLTVEEINEIVKQNIIVSTVKFQNENSNLKYVGKNKAEGIQHILYRCPKCKKIATITPSGDDFCCAECGLKGTYTDQAKLLLSENVYDIDSVLKWDRWQKNYLIENGLEIKDDEDILCEDFTLYLIKRAAKNEYGKLGKLHLKKDRFEFVSDDGEVTTFTFDNIRNISIQFKDLLQFHLKDGRFFEAKSKEVTSMVKYCDLFCYLKAKLTGKKDFSITDYRN